MSVCIDELSSCRGETQIPQSLSMGGAGVLDDVAHVMRKQGGTPSPHGGVGERFSNWMSWELRIRKQR